MNLRPLPLLLLAAFAVAADTPADGAKPAPKPVTGTTTGAKPYFGVQVNETAAAGDANPGLPLANVTHGSTAHLLGIAPGDRLLTVNGKPVKRSDDLAAILGGSKVGDPITVEFVHAGATTSATGSLIERPKPAGLTKDVDQLQQQMGELRSLAEAAKREPSLAEVLQQLKDIETGLPRAVAAFKKQYPNGEFDIRLSVTICSDKTAKEPLDFGNVPATAAAVPAATPATAPAVAP